jgi:hypothetical protein
MTRRSAVLVAWSMVAAYWVLVAVGFALRAINDPAYFPADDLSWRLVLQPHLLLWRGRFLPAGRDGRRHTL